MIPFQIKNPLQINAILSKICKRNLHFWDKSRIRNKENLVCLEYEYAL